MIKSRLVDGKVLLSREDEDRKPLLQRLARVEGQIRGIRAMIEEDRYCGDELQQVKAALSALREFAILLAEQHISASVELASGKKREEKIRADIGRILRDALRL
jgi:DNA-binding FrmR family transcriptional regulator